MQINKTHKMENRNNSEQTNKLNEKKSNTLINKQRIGKMKTNKHIKKWKIANNAK